MLRLTGGQKRKSSSQRAGCGYLLLTGIVLVSLFMLNNIVVKALFGLDVNTTDERLYQAGQLLLPIGMLFIQLWFIDWLRGVRK